MRRPKALAKAATLFRTKRRKAVVGIALLLLLATTAVAWRSLRPARRHAPPAAILPADNSPAPRPTRVITFAEGCMTARCHTAVADAPVVHAPITAHACDTCHAPDAGSHKYPLARAKEKLCITCHDVGSSHLVQHKAMSEADSCLLCHDPHASNTRALLARTPAKTDINACDKCHPRDQGSVSHRAYAENRCEICHAPHGGDNPGLLLASSVANNCRVCHAATVRDVETKSHSHRDLKGSCVACHSPHAAPFKGLLAAPPRESCVTCHADVGAAVDGATVSHDPVLKDEQCIRCHDPHGTNQPGMLRTSQADTCLSCHDKPLKSTEGRAIPSMASLADQPVIHGSAIHGQCSACHSVHGGNHAKLLREVNNTIPLGPYDARNYALCFSCHDSHLADSPARTQFRDDTRNLHQVHLRNGDKSRSCAACHAVHAGDQPRLIAKFANFEGSNWAMPIGFTLLPDGGRCGPGCHEPLSYSRKPGGIKANPAPHTTPAPSGASNGGAP